MGAMGIVSQWTMTLQSGALAGFRLPLVKALALFSAAMLQAGSCLAWRIATAMAGDANVASRRRRWERWLADEGFDSVEVQKALAAAAWRRRCWKKGDQALLVVDETSGRNDTIRCLQVSLAFRKRALPLACACYEREHPPGGMTRLMVKLLDRATESAPAGVAIDVTADRGLSWPALLDACAERKWGFLLRLQGQTRVRIPQDADAKAKAKKATKAKGKQRGSFREVQAKELVCKPGVESWCGPAEIFRKAGWRSVTLIAMWTQGCKEPWLLATDATACTGQWKRYAKRMWIEQTFRDVKSSGLNWHHSRVTDPAHADRLITVVALAVLLAMSMGIWAIKRGHRHEMDTCRSRRLSLFQIGQRTILAILNGNRPNWPFMLDFSSA
jgi:hypothetical protein